MTYQELVKCYPWVDLAMEIFKGVMPTIVAIVTVIVTQFCIKKRELQYKKKEMRLEYLEKILNWIHEIKNDIFEISSLLDTALAVSNPEKRHEKCSEVIKKLNKMNLSIATWADTYSSVTTVFGYDLKLKDLKKCMCDFGDEMMDIITKYIRKPDTSDATMEINTYLKHVISDLNVSVMVIAKEIDLLYKK